VIFITLNCDMGASWNRSDTRYYARLPLEIETNVAKYRDYTHYTH
jgi:hypothetical protein